MQTKGWDTVSLIKKEKVNSDLKSNWDKIDPNFQLEKQNEYTMHGIFSHWSIVEGGGGKLLRLKMPIKSGEIIMEGVKRNLSGTSAIIEVTLALLNKRSNIASLETAFKNKAKQKNEIPINDIGGWLLPIKLEDPNKQVGTYSAVVIDAICEYLILNPLQFLYIFAEINFIKPESPEWVIPKKCTYIYLNSGYLAILSVCSNKDTTNFPLDIDVTGISLGVNSIFILSNQMVLENLILPGLLEIFQKAHKNQYYFRENQLRNSCEMRMHQIKSGAIYYTPIVYSQKNISQVEGDKIKVSYDGTCDLKAGIDMYWNGYVKMSTHLGTKGRIDFIQKEYNFYHKEDIPWYLKWLSPIVSIITAIVVSVISEDLIKSISKHSSSIHTSDLDIVTWCGGSETIVSSVYLSESLIVEYK